MSDKRNKVVSTSVDDGRATLNCYSDPANGEQHVTNTLVYDVRSFATPTLLNLAAFGFIVVAGNRYQRGDGHPDVPAITQALYEEMVAGDWQPGKRDTGPSEPTDLMRAIAEATNTPLHVVQHEFETRMQKRNDGSLYLDKAGKPRRVFSTAMQKKLAADPAIAPIIARLEQERAKATLASLKGNKQPSQLSALFAVSEPAEAEAAQ